jgi:uncharacterized protein
VSFEDASEVFRDPLFVSLKERVQDGERRWQTLGMARKAGGSLLLLVVVHTVREDLEQGTFNEVVRIISARRAVPEERTSYENENG